MSPLDPINRTLMTVLDNQVARTQCTFDGLSEAVFNAPQACDCKSIRQIGQHLLQLRRFQLSLLGSPLAGEVADPQSVNDLPDLLQKLVAATDKLKQALQEHPPQDWYAPPDKPREGPWGDEPTIARFVRPLNDFTNHLGSIRAVRRCMGDPAEQTQ